MKAKELFFETDISPLLPDMEISGISCDSRRVKDGYLFICQRGGRTDGHKFIDEAKRNGASLILGEYEVSGANDMLLTHSTRRAESKLWYNFTGRPTDGMTKIAVTGTAGKTSVAFLIRHILMAAGRKVGIISTVGVYSGNTTLSVGENGGSSVSDIHGAMTTPDPEYFFSASAEMKEQGCDTLIYEASSQAISLGKISAISPDIAVFTNLSPEHLDYHKSMESYFSSKASLMEGAGVGIVNCDDRWMAKLPELYNDSKFVRCTARSENIKDFDVCAAKYKSRGADGIEYLYYSGSAVFGVKTPLVGRYSVYNTMEAVTCAIRLGVDSITVKEALADYRGVPGRLSKIDFSDLNRHCVRCRIPTVFIDYAHTPEAISEVLNAVREISSGRVIALFGCGGDRDRKKRPDMAKASLENADFTVITSDNPRTEDPMRIIEDILAGVGERTEYTVIPDRREAILYATDMLEGEDTLVLLGKGHEKYEITAHGKFPFDEEQIAKEAMYKKIEKEQNNANNLN